MEPCKKHPCHDCNFCQFCSEIRCIACRKPCSKTPKMTTEEQIVLFEKINSEPRFPEKPIYYKKSSHKESA